MQISVYITSFNQKTFLIEAIESVLAQTLKPSQIIIVDDASQDNSQEVIAGYRSLYPDFITAIFHEKNLGIARTRVDALNAVMCEYVTSVDGDDRILPTKLEKEAKLLLKNSQDVIAFSNNFYISYDGNRTGKWITIDPPPEGEVFCQTFSRDYPRRNLFRMELIPYNAWKNIGFHDINLTLLEDWEMRIRLTKWLRTVYLDEPLSEHRVHPHGLSKIAANVKLEALEYIWQKNKHLLNDIEPKQKGYVEEKINEWRARFIRMSAKEELIKSDHSSINKKDIYRLYMQSLKYQRVFDIDLILGCLLPNKIYTELRSAVKKFTGHVGFP